jgi:hypothetical protein
MGPDPPYHNQGLVGKQDGGRQGPPQEGVLA